MADNLRHSPSMIQVEFTRDFQDWFERLRDLKARELIVTRIDRARLGNPGKVRDIGSGLSEMKIDYGQGYRVYFVQRGAVLIVILCGGDKSTQRKDIAKAKRLAKELKQ